MEQAFIAALYDKGPAQGSVKTVNRSHKLIARDADGRLTTEYVATLPTSLVGGYQGKAGTIRRSRKGRTSRNANGRRFYVTNYEREVVAYE